MGECFLFCVTDQKIFWLILNTMKTIDVKLVGNSMEPFLKANDIITIRQQDLYTPGDILVFKYKEHQLLVHRLLMVKDGVYYCKGDNSFRIEDITIGQIAGRVISKNGYTINHPPDELIKLSYQVNREYKKLGYNSELILNSSVYCKYWNYVNSIYDKIDE